MEEEKILEKEGKILRQPKINRFIHWAIAISTFALIFSGLGQMPVYRRYNVDKIISWASNYDITLWLHYMGAVLLGFTILLHVFYHGVVRKEFDIFPRFSDFKESYFIIKAMLGFGKEPPSEKYLAEQRLAYAFIGFSLLLVLFSGLIKTYTNMPWVQLTTGLHYWATTIHNIGTILVILGVIAHIGAFIVPDNRVLLPAMFTGKVGLNYVKDRHPKWMNKLKNSDNSP